MYSGSAVLSDDHDGIKEDHGVLMTARSARLYGGHSHTIMYHENMPEPKVRYCNSHDLESTDTSNPASIRQDEKFSRRSKKDS